MSISTSFYVQLCKRRSQKCKKHSQAVSLFCTFWIFTCKSFALNVGEIDTRFAQTYNPEAGQVIYNSHLWLWLEEVVSRRWTRLWTSPSRTCRDEVDDALSSCARPASASISRRWIRRLKIFKKNSEAARDQKYFANLPCGHHLL